MAEPATTYYALLTLGRTRDDPSGVARRRVTADGTVDEVFTRRLRWEPTQYFARYRLGHNDTDHVEITEQDAEAFVQRVTAKLS